MMKFTKMGVKLGSHCTRKQTTNTQLGTSIIEIKLKKFAFQKIIGLWEHFLKTNTHGPYSMFIVQWATIMIPNF